MKYLIDVDRLVADKQLTAEAAAVIKRKAKDSLIRMGMNAILIAGILCIVGGVATLLESSPLILIAGALLSSFGVISLLKASEDYYIPSLSAAATGAILATGASIDLLDSNNTGELPLLFAGVIIFYGSLSSLLTANRPRLRAFLIFTTALALSIILYSMQEDPTLQGVPAPILYLSSFVMIAATGIALDFRLLTALSATPFIQAIFPKDFEAFEFGLNIEFREPALIIWMAAVLFSAALLQSRRFEAKGRKHLARHFQTLTSVSFIWVNLGFWIGSWRGDRGDYVGLETWGPGQNHLSPADDPAALEAMLHIPDFAFSIAWALLLLLGGILAVRCVNRPLLNSCILFGSIHLLGQFMDRMDKSPIAFILVGLAAILVAFATWKFNRSLQIPAAEETK